MRAIDTANCVVGGLLLLGDGVGGHGGDAAVVVLLRHEYVAVVAPIGRPGILDEPVRLPVELAVSDRRDGVVEALRSVVAILLVVNAAGIEREAPVPGVDRDGHGPVLRQGHLQRRAVARGHVDVTGDGEVGLRLVQMAETVLP